MKFLDGLDLASQKITTLADGSSANDAATYGQLLNLVNGKDYKDGVVAASTTNVSVSSPGATLDGVTLASNDRILLKDQSTPSQNGVWAFNGASSALTRPVDFPTGTTALVTQGATVVVDGGTTNTAQQWTLTTTGAINVDTTGQAWTRTTAAGASYTAGNGLQLVSTAFSAKLPASSGLVADGTGLYLDAAIAVKKYAANVGDNSSTDIVVNHNLGTRDVIVQLRLAASAYSAAVTDWDATDANNVTLHFAVAPTTGQYRVVVHG